MKSVILFIEVAFPSIILGVVTLILVMNMGCKQVETVQAVELEVENMMTLKELNEQLESDVWCETRKIEAISYTDPEQYLVTIKRQ